MGCQPLLGSLSALPRAEGSGFVTLCPSSRFERGGSCWAREPNVSQPIQLRQCLHPGQAGLAQALQKYIYQEPKSGAMSQHSQRSNGLDSCFLEVFLR